MCSPTDVIRDISYYALPAMPRVVEHLAKRGPPTTASAEEAVDSGAVVLLL